MKNTTTALTLIAMIIFSPILVASAETAITDKAPWAPPKDFVNPATLLVQELKGKGFETEKITAELEKRGMGWYPKTGATWMGRAVTSEELEILSLHSEGMKNEAAMRDSLDRKVGCMRATDYSWAGIGAEMISGSMSVSSDGTQYHYACVQLGDLDGASNYAEVVVTHNYGEDFKWYVYDSDEGGFNYYMDKNTGSSSVDTYVIMLDGSYDSDGYHYDVWINYGWVMSGHLSNCWLQAGYQKEVYSYGQYDDDYVSSIFYRNWLNANPGWIYWTNSISSRFSANYPVQESHTWGGLCYNWNTWVNN